MQKFCKVPNMQKSPNIKTTTLWNSVLNDQVDRFSDTIKFHVFIFFSTTSTINIYDVHSTGNLVGNETFKAGDSKPTTALLNTGVA